jgi:hypothetical protein
MNFREGPKGELRFYGFSQKFAGTRSGMMHKKRAGVYTPALGVAF